MFFSKKSKKYVLFLLCVVTLGLRANFDYLDMYMLEPSLYTDKVTVHNYTDSFTYHLSFDDAIALGILQDYKEIVQEATSSMKIFGEHFCVDKLLGVINDNTKDTRLITFLKAASAAIACYGLYGGFISFRLPKPARYTILGLDSIVVAQGLFGYLCMKHVRSYLLSQNCKRILRLDRSLFAIVDMAETKNVWCEIKLAMDDAKLAQKVEDFFGIV